MSASKPKPQGKCVDCGRWLPMGGRGLCANRCWRKHRTAGTLEDFPRSYWKNADLMAELGFWRDRGLSVRKAAEKIGVKPTTLRRAIQRARERQCNPS